MSGCYRSRFAWQGERGSNTTLDDEFGRDLETVVRTHCETAHAASVRLILDSSVAIAAERRRDTVQAFLQRVIDTAGDQEAALSPVGVVELVHGIHRETNRLESA
jgi:hypothetical protein